MVVCARATVLTAVTGIHMYMCMYMHMHMYMCMHMYRLTAKPT